MKHNSSQSWVDTIRHYYRSGASNQFVIYGNIFDQFVLKTKDAGSLNEALLEITEQFDYVLVYQPSQGIIVAKGGDVTKAPAAETPYPDACIPEMADCVRRLVYRKLEGSEKSKTKPAVKIALIIHDVEKIAPAGGAKSTNYPLMHLVATLKAWSTDDIYRDYPLATFLVANNLADLHPDLKDNPRALQVRVDLPNEEDIQKRLEKWAISYPRAIAIADIAQLARGLRGVTLDTIEQEIRLAHFSDTALATDKISAIKKKLIEKEAGDLLEFIAPKETLNDVEGLTEAKTLIRTHLRMWKEGKILKFPKGYMFIGPVGTGKTYLLKCVAGEGLVPVVKLKNFRNMWYGSTEANLERIFRILRALAPCIVFIDEADQALGKRDSGANDGGLSGRIYSMMAQEMSDPDTRGQILWVFATSRPDLVEIDLKRPGRIDVKFALMPSGTPEEAARLIRSLLKRINILLTDDEVAGLLGVMPDWVTPGAAEAIASELYTRLDQAKTDKVETTPAKELRGLLEHYQPPVPLDRMLEQIKLAVNECTSIQLVPEKFRSFKQP